MEDADEEIKESKIPKSKSKSRDEDGDTESEQDEDDDLDEVVSLEIIDYI